MTGLKISVSGIRGIWGESLNIESLSGFIKAFVIFLKNRNCSGILIGRDARPTGAVISSLVVGIMNAFGIDVLDCGIIPTPTVLFGVRKLMLGGGIIISASHNPIEWNALKFVIRDGIFPGEEEIKLINSYIGMDIRESPYDRIGRNKKNKTVEEMHINAILNNISVSAIKDMHFRIVLDPVNSAGCRIGQKLLEKLGCEVRLVNGEINGSFGRGPEPIPSNLVHMTPAVREFNADAGFAMDPDADRLVLVDEKGAVLSEEMTFALCADHVLSLKRGDIVTNYSTSMLSDWIAGKYGVHCYRTKVGEANVTAGIFNHKAVIGGEGNGGIIYPAINPARDSLAGMALILEMMAKRNKHLSELTYELPHYFMLKEKIETPLTAEIIFGRIKKEFPNAVIDDTDGIRLDWDEKGARIWIHIRPSNTEPVFRIIGESSDENLLKSNLGLARELMIRQ